MLGVAALGVVLILSLLVTILAGRHLKRTDRKPRPLLTVLEDSAGWPSLAYLQLFLWGVIVIFAVLWVSLVRLFSGLSLAMTEIPVNLLTIALIGIGAIPISTHVSNQKYYEKYKRPTEKEREHMNHWHSMLQEKGIDKEYHATPTRVQLLLWTAVSIAIYAGTLIAVMFGVETLTATEGLSIPDLDEVFLILMGLSQVGYIGGKWVAKRPEQE